MDGKILVTFQEFGDVHFTSTGRGSKKDRDKNGKKTGKLTILKGFSRQIIEAFSAGVIRTLLRGASSTFHAVSDFEVLFLDTLS